jgi:hypothetical protein
VLALARRRGLGKRQGDDRRDRGDRKLVATCEHRTPRTRLVVVTATVGLELPAQFPSARLLGSWL